MMLDGAKIVVVGGAGLIGSHTVDLLLAEGVEEIVVFDNLARGTVENLAGAVEDSRVRLVEGDLADRRHLGDVLAGADGVFHLYNNCGGLRNATAGHVNFRKCLTCADRELTGEKYLPDILFKRADDTRIPDDGSDNLVVHPAVNGVSLVEMSTSRNRLETRNTPSSSSSGFRSEGSILESLSMGVSRLLRRRPATEPMDSPSSDAE
jgi:hypothetical protein